MDLIREKLSDDFSYIRKVAAIMLDELAKSRPELFNQSLIDSVVHTLRDENSDTRELSADTLDSIAISRPLFSQHRLMEPVLKQSYSNIEDSYLFSLIDELRPDLLNIDFINFKLSKSEHSEMYSFFGNLLSMVSAEVSDTLSKDTPFRPKFVTIDQLQKSRPDVLRKAVLNKLNFYYASKYLSERETAGSLAGILLDQELVNAITNNLFDEESSISIAALGEVSLLRPDLIPQECVLEVFNFLRDDNSNVRKSAAKTLKIILMNNFDMINLLFNYMVSDKQYEIMATDILEELGIYSNLMVVHWILLLHHQNKLLRDKASIFLSKAGYSETQIILAINHVTKLIDNPQKMKIISQTIRKVYNQKPTVVSILDDHLLRLKEYEMIQKVNHEKFEFALCEQTPFEENLKVIANFVLKYKVDL